MFPILRYTHSLPETLVSNEEDCCSIEQTDARVCGNSTEDNVKRGTRVTPTRAAGIQEELFQFKRSQSYKIKRDVVKDKCDEGRNKNLPKASAKSDDGDKISQNRSYVRRRSASFSEYGILGKISEEYQPLRRNQTVGHYNHVKKLTGKSVEVKMSGERHSQRTNFTSISEFNVLQVLSKEISLYRHFRSLRSHSYTNFRFGKISSGDKDDYTPEVGAEQKKRWEKRKTLEGHRKSSSFSNLKDLERLTQDICNEKLMVDRTVSRDQFGQRRAKQYVGARSLDNCQPQTFLVFQRSERFKQFGSSFNHGQIKKSQTFCLQDDLKFRRNDPLRKPIQAEMLKHKKQDYHCNRNEVKETFDDSCDDCNEPEEEKKNGQCHDKNMFLKIEDTNIFLSQDRLDGETEEDAEMRRAALRTRTRTRSSTIVEIPTASIQMDLHTLYLENINTNSKGMKKGKQLEEKKKLHRGVAIYGGQDEDYEKKAGRFAMIKHKFKNKERSTLDNFKDFLEHLRSNLVEVFQHDLEVYKDSHWSTVNQLNDSVPENDLHKQATISDSERERYEALWELFYAEVSYLLDHLLVLQNVFSKPLQHAKEFGFLQEVDDVTLFPNLDSLIHVTSNFAMRLLKIFKCCGVSVSKSTEIIVEAFNEFDSLLTPQYNGYCLNYQKAKDHLSKLKKEDELFVEFIKWGEHDERCQRRRVEDFLVAPLQHLTKYPLLLKAIRKHTSKNDINNHLLTMTIFDIEQSIKSIERKISSLINLQRMQEIFEIVKWPSLAEYDHKSNIPDFVRTNLNLCRSDTIFRNPNRSILLEGYVTLADNNKSELYLFLFNDMLLVTKCRKKIKRRLTGTDVKSLENDNPKRKQTIRESSNTQYIVQQQPIPLDRLKLYDCDEQASTSFKNSFCVVHFNRYHQPITVYTFQLPTNSEKTKWTTQLKKAKESISEDISSDEELML